MLPVSRRRNCGTRSDLVSNMQYLMFLQAIVVVTTVAEFRTTRPRGMYTLERHLHDSEVVFPRKVTLRGDLISHNVTHHHDGDENGDGDLHFRLTRGGTEYHLQLTPANDFISPGMIVERRKRDIHVRHSAKTRSSKCHYRGHIRGQANSRVALSACEGLTGVIHSKHGEFWLEPIANEFIEQSKNEARSANILPSEMAEPHLLFRRSAGRLELTTGTKRRPKKKKKKKHERNCGTREPRRLTETHLEWQSQPGLVQVQGRGRRKHRLKRWQRAKRSVSQARHVEALVVADTTMMAFHQDGDVETYLLTIMNMVSALYLDPTIGNFINVVVVRIILMEEDEAEQGLNITINADRTLYNFCKWQQKLNPDEDSHPNHHDVAILITREDICSRANTPCSTLGVAHVAGMCQPDRSCSVNEDNGITLAHTIAHELGHNFGMYHDTDKIGCSRRHGNILHVMTPTFEADTMIVAWSKCSRRDITNFLDEGKGTCLEDEPADNDYAYPDLPPGAMYNAEHQCRLQFGVREASVCSPLQEVKLDLYKGKYLNCATSLEGGSNCKCNGERVHNCTKSIICSKLWCVVDGTCTTMLNPAAPGTHCGKHMWCQNQECVPILDKPTQIDGGWGEWGPWSECSRSCEAGVSVKERRCDHPEPAFGGRFCIGKRRRYKICNIEPCPEGAPSFRSVQCSDYNGKEYKEKNYTWLPYFDQTEPCELYCTDTEERVIVPWGEAVLDGTPCNVGSRDMCIAGICRKVGCDWRVDSDATEDRCGICHGDGTQCETTSGLYDENEGPGYKEVIIIPAGSRNIKIEEVGNSKNYIGIGVPNSDEYFLNGKRQITLAGEYLVAGTPALYERDHERERIRIPGPIKEDISIYMIYRGQYRNLGLKYEYTVPKKEADYTPEYSWVFSDWSLCTVTCGGGVQSSRAFCHEVKSGIVGDQFCNETAKPEPIARECNTKPCPARWWVGPWQMCPVTCGEGALRKRSVMCVSSGKGTDSTDLALPDRDCDKDARPEEVEPCPNLPPCGSSSEVPFVVYSEDRYSAFYNITSSDQDGITIVDSVTSEEPEILEFDNVVDENPQNSLYTTKPKWIVSKWSVCQLDRRSRKLACSIPGECRLQNKPATSEDCRRGKWVAGKWSTCKATCAPRSGFKYRNVVCRDRVTNIMSVDCNSERKPLQMRRCHYRKQCGEEKLDCKDNIIPPSICASYKRMCDVSTIVRGKCCATCKKRQRHARHNRRHEFGN